MAKTAHQYALAWHNALTGKNEKEWKKISRAFLAHLHARGMLSHLPDIVRIMQTTITASDDTVRAIITTAQAIDEKTIAAIQKTIFDTKKIHATHRIDPQLIGGFVATTTENRWNASIAGKLSLLKKQLTAH